ncbi:hypothetical protein GOEFS_097_00020 [Gordonia effusa NBRC 100432]|uniref:Metal-dependent hydrolase n=1 Tax=Gordonia effusa NBRC 100432 TaxID=1077974 RepID=H0R4D2_9ACTN|nr:metal-dependent hydrolase [Gordonia effusa]GAB19933.1 hypothetical protein GOEFS_097_00020 [Gordonia effusa NBRC 100432]
MASTAKTTTDSVPTSTGPVELHARDVSFDVRDVNFHWIPKHPYVSNLVTGANLLLPEGERWFVKTFEEALPMVRDEELAAEMRGFIGQEAMHAAAHDQALVDFVKANGIDPEPFQRQVEWVFRKLLAPKPKSSARAQRKHLVERLWLIAAAEHYTAVLGDFALNSTWREAGADPAMADLFLWHAAEEVEHRCVAYNVASYFGDSYLRRGRAMVAVVPGALILFFRAGRYISLRDSNGPIRAHRRFFQYQRAVRAGMAPSVPKVLLHSINYFNPWFHPSQVGNTAQAVAYLATSPAARNAH